VEIHWTNLMDAHDGDERRIGLRDALLQSLSCQTVWASVATFDSALHLGLVTSADVSIVFACAPKRAQRVARVIDACAESGPESILRMIVGSAGFCCVYRRRLRVWVASTSLSRIVRCSKPKAEPRIRAGRSGALDPRGQVRGR
jgi:hypothetical protein